MPKINYVVEADAKTTARAGVSNSRISWKDSVEVARFIKGMKSAKAKAFLQDVIKLKRAVPLKKFNDNRGHKPGKLGPGRYPINVSKIFLALLESAESNAEAKGLDAKNLVVKYAFANKGQSFSRPRKNDLRGQVRKSANISVILEHAGEIVGGASKASKEPQKKAGPKQEMKKQEKKIEAKPEAANAESSKPEIAKAPEKAGGKNEMQKEGGKQEKSDASKDKKK